MLDAWRNDLMERTQRPSWRTPPRQFTAALVLALSTLGVAAPALYAQPIKKAPTNKVKLGLVINDPRAFQGYTVLSPMNSTTTYLLDMQGKVVHSWKSNCTPALCAYLLDNGHLLRPGTVRGEKQAIGGPGAGGRIQEFTWEGELVWDFKFSDDRHLPHHDITRLPSGNVLMIVWDKKTGDEAIAAGRRPDSVQGSHLLPDSLYEVQPTGKTTGKVVWEWHLWDHLVQDLDKSKANYGNVAAHPELVDINYGQDTFAKFAAKKGGLDKLKAIGYVGDAPPPKKGRRGTNPDWTHFNGVAYNADLDQIIVSVHAFSEFWILDHSTTTAEAASHAGGRSGKGGDLLYRWGNPLAYRAGTKADQRLFAQHNAHWIAKGLPGAGHLLVFNNGNGRPGGSSSSVDEIVLPVDKSGRYAHKMGTAYAPDQPVWTYAAPKKADFFSTFISGAERLPNGNTLICSGANGTIFEVTPDKEIVWKYVNPAKGGPGPGGPMFGGPPRIGDILPTFLQDRLQLTPEQKKQVENLQKETDRKLARLLTGEQRKQWREMRQGGPGGLLGFGPGRGPGGFGPPGGAAVFRVYRYAANHPGLAGRDLMPGRTIEELEAKETQKKR
jgi:hypothetical protein